MFRKILLIFVFFTVTNHRWWFYWRACVLVKYLCFLVILQARKQVCPGQVSLYACSVVLFFFLAFCKQAKKSALEKLVYKHVQICSQIDSTTVRFSLLLPFCKQTFWNQICICIKTQPSHMFNAATATQVTFLILLLYWINLFCHTKLTNTSNINSYNFSISLSHIMNSNQFTTSIHIISQSHSWLLKLLQWLVLPSHSYRCPWWWWPPFLLRWCGLGSSSSPPSHGGAAVAHGGGLEPGGVEADVVDGDGRPRHPWRGSRVPARGGRGAEGRRERRGWGYLLHSRQRRWTGGDERRREVVDEGGGRWRFIFPALFHFLVHFRCSVFPLRPPQLTTGPNAGQLLGRRTTKKEIAPSP